MDEYAIRLLALEIAHMLPENTKDALHALDLARAIAEDFLCKGAEVVAFMPQVGAGL